MKKTNYVLFLCLFVFMACSNDEQIQQEQTVEANLRGATPKSQVCHYDTRKDNHNILSVSGKNLQNHLNHGDVLLIDADGDGYAAFNECGYLNENGIDCDETDAAINPGATEICDNGIDDNCNGQIDEGCEICGNGIDDNGNGLTDEGCEICGNGIDDNGNGQVDEGCIVIGDNYQGGKIAYILQDGDPGYDANTPHGLIAATSDQSTGIQWHNGSYVTTGATGTALGIGQTNTTAIVNAQGPGSYAAQLCDDYSVTVGATTYSDWYLPSKDELNKLYENRVAIGGFGSDFYWSSTEDGYNFFAWDQSFGTGIQASGYKDNSDRVRAVRAF